MKPLQILLIGAGNMGSLHARVIHNSSETELAAVVDPQKKAGEALAENFDTKWFPELSDLTKIDGVVLAAATEAHFDLAKQVLEANTPLLIEKPVANNIEESIYLVELSRSSNIPIMCGLLERFNPAVLTAKSLLQSQPWHLSSIRHSPYAPRIRTGVTWDLLIHDVDLAIRFLGGNILTVSGLAGSYHPSSLEGAEDVAEAVLGFDSGAIASVSASRIGQKKIRSMSIYEPSRLIEIDLLRKDVTVYRHVSDQPASMDGRGYRQQTVIEIPELVTSQEPLAAQLEHFVKLIKGDADANLERESILPSHEAIARIRT